MAFRSYPEREIRRVDFLSYIDYNTFSEANVLIDNLLVLHSIL